MYQTEEQKLVRRLVIILGIAIVLTIVYILTNSTACGTQACFEENMLSCSKAHYINEETEASWQYQIKGVERNQCKIEVTLLNAKQGSLGIDSLEGQSMNCYYPPNVAELPEKNLDLCHGLLKESLQARIIAQLHEYIIGNLGTIGGI